MIPTMGSSLFSAPWTSNFHPCPRLISPAFGLGNPVSQTLLPLPKVAYNFGGSAYLRADLAHTHSKFTSIAPGTWKLTYSPGREGNKHPTNSYAVTHEKRLVRCSRFAPGLSWSNPIASRMIHMSLCYGRFCWIKLKIVQFFRYKNRRMGPKDLIV